MSKQTPQSDQDSAPDLAKALKENRQATKAVQQAADDLSVVHAVLDSEVPKETLAPDVGEAIERTDQLEKKLNESGKNLEKVNEKLARELAKRSS
ncbi:hypothetical protein [Variovorax sp. PAMC26660]|uniref:hypothetical protein n=1 Tax=Variovorax sp. PAMC26660 TaxID=2762322 RepID=UPI00164EC8A6|nr:hypothetical protein [Variovorax sp. PAMC26660]QNK67193.1 hypothetical protein H7F35_29225 [Variovorax sp. PAMC26660]